MSIFFISDLHLIPSRPDITNCFLTFMQTEAIHADALYVLGDLFDFWVGDDDNRPFSESIRNAFKTLTDAGVPCYFTRGNRDFLVGNRFARQTGITLLDDESIVDLYGRKALILHGDTLCIDDYKYLAFRAKVHQQWAQWIYNNLIPFTIKKRIVAKVQADTGSDKKTKSMAIMDVNQGEVERVLASYGVDLMIHGHTHRPNIHHFSTAAGDQTRIVLGDWHIHGSILSFDPQGYQLETRSFAAPDLYSK